MSVLVVKFEKEWLDLQRGMGVRVIRQLEKWIASLGDVSLKNSSGDSLTVEIQLSGRSRFLEAFATRMKTEFGEDLPWGHATFSGDLSGLDLPQSVPPPQAEKAKPEPADQPADAAKPAQPAPEQPDVPKSGKISEEAPPPDPRETLEEVCGRVPIKHSRALEAYVREMAAVIPTLLKMGVASTLWHQHLLMAVDAGYGRSEFLSALVKLYKAFGLVNGELDKKSIREYILLPQGEEQAADGYRVTWDTVLEAAQDMNRSNTRNGISRVVLYIDISAWQTKLATSEVKTRLRRLNSLCGTFLVVFRVPFLEGHVLRETADALNDILNVRTLAVPPAPIDDMVDYARESLAANDFRLAPDATPAFEQWILREKVDDSFFGYKTMDKIVQKVIYEKALSNCRGQVEDRVIGIDDLKISSNAEAEDRPVDELEKMVGMEKVRRRIDEIIVQIKTLKELAAQGKRVARPAIHMLFTGNPGTGKTTVARILARMMHQAGILRKGHLVEVKGRDLCGQYIGETAPKTSAICRDAYGSVLFIDEAYSLFRDEDASSRDYGREAMDTLVAEMENHRDDLCVIMAGYKDEIDAMLKGNAGLRSRIPYEIEFPNYSREDLEKIFFTMIDGMFDYEEGLRDAVHAFFEEMPEETFLSKEFSNARLVRNLYERTWGKAAYRKGLEGGGEIRILKSDLAGATADSEFKKLLKKNVERRTIGFDA